MANNCVRDNEEFEICENCPYGYDLYTCDNMGTFNDCEYLKHNTNMDIKWKDLGVCKTVGELINILKDIPLDSEISAAGGDCHVLFNGSTVVFDEKDYSDEWNIADYERMLYKNGMDIYKSRKL